MLKKTLFTLFMAALLAACMQAPDSNNSKENISQPVACTQEAKICPDGSTVGRSGPSCEFAACPISETASDDSNDVSNLNSSTMSDNTISLSELPTDDCISPTSSANYPQQTTCPGLGATVAKISTSYGDIWLSLFSELTPKTVENFIGLAKEGYYDGLIFHRVIPNFMIQGGDPMGTGVGGESLWGSEFEDEFTAELTNIRGALSMANRGPNTNGSQFFIVQAPDGTPWLNGKHTVFGQVISGLNVVDKIANVKTTVNDKPAKDVVMQKVEIFSVVE